MHKAELKPVLIWLAIDIAGFGRSRYRAAVSAHSRTKAL